jgi:hypothetical protein
MTGLTAKLHANRNGCVWQVEFDGESVVVGSRDPECDLARALLARGITGTITILDGNTGKPRTFVNIEKAARLTVEEGPNGPRFVKRRQTRVDRSLTAESALVLSGLSTEYGRAA